MKTGFMSEYESTSTKYYTWYGRDAQGNLLCIYTANGVSPVSMPINGNKWLVYGSSRLGTFNYQVGLNGGAGRLSFNKISYTERRGVRFYELYDHLGSDIVTISDKKYGISSGTNGSLTDYFRPDVMGAQQYYPFGSRMPSRLLNPATGAFIFGFNGKEKDQEIKGEWNSYDYGNRFYDPRVGRFLSVDPLTKNFAFYSPYHYAGNNPIRNNDLDGQEPKDYSSNWLYKPIFDLNSKKQIASPNNGITLSDAKLGPINADLVYDKWTKQTWFVHQDDQNNFYYFKSNNGNNSEMSIHPNKNTGLNEIRGGHFEKFATQESLQAKYGYESAEMLAKGTFGIFAGGMALPGLLEVGAAYGSQALTASLGTRLVGSGVNLGFQYLQNAPDNGWGLNNLKNINGTSVGLSFVNPFSIGANAVGSNFGKLTFQNRFQDAIGGSNFNFKSAIIGTAIDFAGSKLGGGIENASIKFGGFTQMQGNVIGNVLGSSITNPANVIAEKNISTKSP